MGIRKCARVFAFALLAWSAFELSGQTRTVITGTARDGKGAVAPGASVVLRSPDMVGGERTTVTDAQGLYRFPDLSPGTYTVRASLPGFQTLERTGLQAPFGTTLTIDLVL